MPIKYEFIIMRYRQSLNNSAFGWLKEVFRTKVFKD